MDWASLFDLPKLATIGTLTMIIIQYIKEAIPEKFITTATVLVGIGISFFVEYKALGSTDVVTTIVNGVMGAMGADSGYQFLSGGKSLPFTLPSKSPPGEK